MILQIHRDTLKPGTEATYQAIEDDAARACRGLNGPHPHLAIAGLTGLKEVWWLNEFESNEDMQRVHDAYANNGPLMAALGDVGKRRRDVIASEVDVFVRDRADLSGGAAWRISGARFFVVLVTDHDSTMEGVVFETADGTRYIFNAARTREAADTIAAHGGPRTAIFAVRPHWGMPAQEWIDADPAFWTR
jgi:hypothetical protein